MFLLVFTPRSLGTILLALQNQINHLMSSAPNSWQPCTHLTAEPGPAQPHHLISVSIFQTSEPALEERYT